MAIRGISFVALVAAIIGTVFFFYPGGNVVPTPLNPGTTNVRGIPIIGLGTWLSEKSKVRPSRPLIVQRSLMRITNRLPMP